MGLVSQSFKYSALVVAHPDDEALWFSSILNKVREVIICFGDNDSNTTRSEGRRKSISEHPIKSIKSLQLKEAGVFNKADWNNPEITEYGMEIKYGDLSLRKYKSNYSALKDRLSEYLDGCKDVFTHNPWGEYGNEEHVQVHRVLKELQNSMKYNLWFSNYCSNKSFNLMLANVSGFDSVYVTLDTDKILGNRLKKLYKKNNCWTWYDNYEWFNNESYMQVKEPQNEVSAYGHIIPLNLINVEYLVRHNRSSETRRTLIRRIIRKIRCSEKK